MSLKLFWIPPIVLISSLILFALIRLVEVFFAVEFLTSSLGTIVRTLLLVIFIPSAVLTPISIVIGIVALILKLNKSKSTT